MRRLFLPLSCAAALSLSAPAVDADPVVPVYLSVAGQGAIRVRLMAGVVAPCDSSSNRTVYDGWLAPGQYVFYTASSNVCMQHTFGVSRAGEWSSPAILPTVIGGRHSSFRRPLAIALSTETPFS